VVSFAPEDRARVSAAVAAAERGSNGEIVTVAAERSDAYHDVGLHYAVLAMLLVPALLAVLPQSAIDRGLGLFAGWDETITRGALMALLFAKLAAVFLIVRYALAWPRLRMALTPGTTKARRVRRRAVELFRAAAERRTAERTGVLLYLSLLERRAEIVADEAIHARVAPELWGDAMAALLEDVKAGRPAEGMVRAVEMIGAILAEHSPVGQGDANELPDRLITL
jgi:putative membrane protein